MHVHDDRRLDRIGMPEAVLCSAKSDSQLRVIVDELASTGQPTLLTRLPAERLGCLSPEVVEQIDHDPISETGILGGMQPGRPGKVAIAAAGTSDQRVATEAARTLEFSGVDAEVFVDIGVAGLWRLEARLPELRSRHRDCRGRHGRGPGLRHGWSCRRADHRCADVGRLRRGRRRLDGTQQRPGELCAGVAVVNIDNGFGAACAAVRMLSLLGTDRSRS